jgi:hypothetical protein
MRQHERKVALNDDRIKATACNSHIAQSQKGDVLTKLGGVGSYHHASHSSQKGVQKSTSNDSHHTKLCSTISISRTSNAGFTNARKETSCCRRVLACAAAKHMQMEDKQKLYISFASQKHIK